MENRRCQRSIPSWTSSGPSAQNSPELRSLALLFGETALGRRFDKPDKGLDVIGSGKGSTHLFESLSGVELGAQEQAIGFLDGLDTVGREAVAFEADGIHAI